MELKVFVPKWLAKVILLVSMACITVRIVEVEAFSLSASASLQHLQLMRIVANRDLTSYFYDVYFKCWSFSGAVAAMPLAVAVSTAIWKQNRTDMVAI